MQKAPGPSPRTPSGSALHPTNAPTNTPAVASFQSCGIEHLRALLDCLTLETTAPLHTLRFIEGGTQSRQAQDQAISACASARVVLLTRDPRRVVTENYLRVRASADATTTVPTLDDFLCAEPGEQTCESRLGLRACLAFMSSVARASHAFDALLVIDADDLEADPWGTMRQLTTFLGLTISEAQWERAARRAGPLAPSHHHAGRRALTKAPPTARLPLATAAPDPFTPYAVVPPDRLATAPAPLELSSGQQVFANHTIAEHLHPMLSRYRKERPSRAQHTSAQHTSAQCPSTENAPRRTKAA